MHIVDITMFYAAEGGGVSTYLNAKARCAGAAGGEAEARPHEQVLTA